MTASRLVSTAFRLASIVAAAGLALAAGVPAGSADQKWTWPVGSGAPAVVNGLDLPAEPWLAGHRGVDLAAPEGTVVRTAGAGIVTYAGRIAGVGVVTVTHGELRTTYQPVDPAVSVGLRVAAGEPIGQVNMTGSHCAPDACLHWGLIRGDTYLDPLPLVRPASGPRLLPLGPAALDPAPGADAAVPGTASAPGQPASTTQRAALGALAGLTPRS